MGAVVEGDDLELVVMVAGMLGKEHRKASLAAEVVEVLVAAAAVVADRVVDVEEVVLEEVAVHDDLNYKGITGGITMA